MSRKRMNFLVLSMALIPTAFLISACTQKTEQAKSVEPPPVVVPANGVLPLVSPTPTPSPAKNTGQPPDPTEIRKAVARIFEKAATPDASRNPSFAVGDFNGDGSEDLAVAVRPNEGSLGEINSELANWILEDPGNISVQGTGATRMPTHKPVRAERADTLLAIIHGVGPQGWRNPEAKQTFLLKNAAGSNILVHFAKDLRKNIKNKQKLPPLKGDAISETVGGKSGLVFWTGAKYAWYSSASN